MQRCDSCGEPVPDEASACAACGAARGARVLRPTFGSPPASAGGAAPPRERRPRSTSSPVVRIPLQAKRHVDDTSSAWGRGEGRGARVVPVHGGEAVARALPFGDAAPETGSHPILLPRTREDKADEAVPDMPPRERKDSTSSSLRRAVCAPPVLASVALREDLRPAQPGAVAATRLALWVGLGGAVVTLLLAGFSALPALCAVVLACVASAGISPLSYRARATALLALGAPGLAVCVAFSVLHAGPPLLALLVVAVCALAGGLLFRAAYRASNLARAVVAGGLVLGVLWLGLGGAWHGVVDVFSDASPGIGGLVAAYLAIPLVLSLLAFMGSDSTGAGRMTSTMLCAWLVVYAAARSLPFTWPLPHESLASAGVLAVALPCFVAVTSVALAQLLVVASGGGEPKKAAA